MIESSVRLRQQKRMKLGYAILALAASPPILETPGFHEFRSQVSTPRFHSRQTCPIKQQR